MGKIAQGRYKALRDLIAISKQVHATMPDDGLARRFKSEIERCELKLSASKTRQTNPAADKG